MTFLYQPNEVHFTLTTFLNDSVLISLNVHTDVKSKIMRWNIYLYESENEGNKNNNMQV